MKKVNVFISSILAFSLFLNSCFSLPVFAANQKSVGDIFSSAADKAKDSASKAKEEAGKAADAAGKAASETAEKASKWSADTAKKAKEAGNEAAKIAKSSLSDLGKEADKASKEISKEAKKAAGAASSGIAKAGASISAAASNVDTDKIEAGWEYVAKLGATNLAVTLGTQDYQRYIKGISDAIELMRVDLNESAKNARPMAQEKGFVFEKWHADTFNIDAAANRSKEWAKRLEENGKGSVDIDTSYDEQASLKAMQNSKESARAQAQEILSDGYYEYVEKAKAAGDDYSLSDYVNNHLTNEEAWEVITAEYAGQTRIVPEDHVENARAYLLGRSEKLDMPTEYSRQQQKVYQETMDSLKDHLEAPDGTKSKPLSSKELQALTESAKEGDVDLSKYDITVSNYVSRSVIVNQILSAGSSAAVLQVAITTGPEIYSIIKTSLENGEVDEEQLKKLGLDAALAGAGGFTEGSVSQAILVACKAGKFGKKMTNVSPDTVGTIAVLTVDAAKYAYMLSKGQITSTDYADIMAEETFVAIASQASGAAVQMLLPMVPFAYLAGSMAGGMLASYGYQVGKEAVLEIKDEGGLMAVLPEEVTDGYNMGKDLLKELSFDKDDDDEQLIPVPLNEHRIKPSPDNLQLIVTAIKT